jgi:outer membrane protein assembly factor BamE
MKPLKPVLIPLVFAASLTACSIHKIDIQQGNVITQESLAKLTIGMEKNQVQRLLGSPMIQDPFHGDRWDYVYRFVVGNTGEVQSGHVSLDFSGAQLSAINVHKQPPTEDEIKTPRLIRE